MGERDRIILSKRCVAIGSGEEYVLLGDYPGIGANDISIRYVDRSGVTASYRPDLGALGATRNTSDFFAVQMTFDPTDGNLIVVGESGDINGRTKPFIFKVDGQKVSWLYELGKDDPDADVQIAHSLIMDDGAAIVAYNVHDDLSEISAFVRIVSINMNTGQESSLSAITQLGDLFASEMIATSSGFAFTGASVFFTGSQKLHITLLDANAQITNSDVEIDKSVGSSIANTFDGGFVIGGSIRNFNNNDFLLLKTDPDGRLEWDEERVLGGESADETSKVLEVDNGYLLFGTSWIENTLARPTLIKTNRSGLLYE